MSSFLLLLLLFSAVIKPWPVVICESHKGVISCPKGKIIDVLNATYGRLNRQTCPHPEITNANCRSSNSLSQVQDECKRKSRCTLHAGNSEFGGDPCSGTYKYLEVKYRCLEFINLGKSETDKMRLNYASHSLLLQWAMFHDLGSPANAVMTHAQRRKHGLVLNP